MCGHRRTHTRNNEPDPQNSWLYCLYRISSVAQSCLTLCDPMNCSTPGLPVHHQLPESTQTHVHWVSDAIQSSHPLSSPSLPALNLSHHQGLFIKAQYILTGAQIELVVKEKENGLFFTIGFYLSWEVFHHYWEVKDEISHFEGRIYTVSAIPLNTLAPPNLWLELPWWLRW